MHWIEFAVRLSPELLDSITDFFVSQGTSGVLTEDEEPEGITVKAYFPDGDHARVVSELSNHLSRLVELFPDCAEPRVSLSKIPDENWAVAWKDNFKTIEVGSSFIVTPPWLKPPSSQRHVIIIDPAEAFGTGTHETTQSCLILLEDAAAELRREKKTWTAIDVGCGSGILAFAAVLLGAASVVAVDNDPKAIESAVHNAGLNNIPGVVDFRCSSLADLNHSASIVTANLDTAAITRHKEALVRLARRFLIISGVPIQMWEEAKQTLQSQSLELMREIACSEWGSGLFDVRNPS